MHWFTFAFVLSAALSSVDGHRVLQTPVLNSASSPAVQAVAELPDQDKIKVMSKVKASTDGINLALASATSNDITKVLKGIGDAVAVLPGAWGYCGVAFSVAASFAALLGGGNDKQDPVLTAVMGLQKTFDKEMHAIETSLTDIQDKVNRILTGIDQVLHDISEIPAKVVADMKLTDVTTMKDKFATVQRAAMQYARGDLTRMQMISKCDDFHVASLFSELETILQDEKHLFTAKFGTQDNANGRVQIQLLLFYLSTIPIVSNCNSLKYSIESIEADGFKSDEIIKTVVTRATWYLQPPDMTIHVRERFNPFASVVDTNGLGDTSQEWSLSLSFRAYSFMPPHGQCFEGTNASGGGTLLVPRTLDPLVSVPNKAMFCIKVVETDDAPHRMVYAERVNGEKTTSLIQPEENNNFDPMNVRGWTLNSTALYSAKVGNWVRLPLLTVISNFIIVQGENAKVSLDDVTNQCRGYGPGYDRDGDGHSKDYSDAPWTIFCVQYVKKSIRDLDATSNNFLSGVQWNEMDASAAWTGSCRDSSYTREKNHITIPSKIRKKWFGLGIQTVKAYAVCLHWMPMTVTDSPNHFVKRVWLDDTKEMADKPQMEQNEGDQAMKLPPTPSRDVLDKF